MGETPAVLCKIHREEAAGLFLPEMTKQQFLLYNILLEDRIRTFYELLVNYGILFKMSKCLNWNNNILE